jgi:hypothetical protein
MTYTDGDPVFLPFPVPNHLSEGHRQNFTDPGQFEQALIRFLAKDRSVYPKREGNLMVLEHSVNISAAICIALGELLVSGGFDDRKSNWHDGDSTLTWWRNRMLQDLVLLPGLDAFKNLIDVRDHYYGAFSRPTFTISHVSK